jgi:hypothetical protein
VSVEKWRTRTSENRMGASVVREAKDKLKGCSAKQKKKKLLGEG